MQNELTNTEKTALGFAKKAAEAKDQSSADWFMRAAVKNADKTGTTLEAIAAKAAAIEAAKAQPKTGRCPHYKTIREFAATAREYGLSMADKDRARGAIGMFLGRRLESRSELTGQEWAFCTNAVRLGKLFW